MKRTLNHCGALGLYALVISSCGGEGSHQEVVGRQHQAIVGGTETWQESAVALKTTQCHFTGDFPAICSALLISPTVVITARHCVSFSATPACPNGVDPTQTATFSVAVGCHDIVNGCPAAKWKSLASQPVLYPGSDDDIAILHLQQAVTAKPMRLVSPARLAEIAAGNSVVLHGWGHTVENGSGSPVLRSVARPIESIPFNLPGFTPQPQGFSTTTGQNPYVGSDHGDSGGPTLVLRDGEWFTLGVIQAGDYGSPRTTHGLIPYYFSWLLSQSSDFPAQSWLPSAQIAATSMILG